MAAARLVMLLSGVTLLVLALIAGLLRSLDLASTDRVPTELFWTILFVVLGLGVVMLIFLPPSRKTERRVDLKPPVMQDKLVRPQTGGASRTNLPVTRTATKKQASPQKKPEANASGPSSQSQTRPPVKESPTTGTKGSASGPHADGRGDTASRDPGSNGSSNGHGEAVAPPSLRPKTNGGSNGNGHGEHPVPSPVQEGPPGDPQGRDPETDRPPSFRSRERQESRRKEYEEGDREQPSRNQVQLSHTKGAQAPPSMRGAADVQDASYDQQSIEVSPDKDARQRMNRRREELESRLESLEQRANSAKVSLGLGRISHAGYRQYMKEVERERTLIEGELIALRDD